MAFQEKNDVKSMAVISVGIAIIIMFTMSFYEYTSKNSGETENLLGKTGTQVWTAINGNNELTQNIEMYKVENQ